MKRHGKQPPQRTSAQAHPPGTPEMAAMNRREFLAAGALAAAGLALVPAPVRSGQHPLGIRIPRKPLDPGDLATREGLAG